VCGRRTSIDGGQLVESILSDICICFLFVPFGYGHTVDLEWTLDKVEGGGITLTKPKKSLTVIFAHDDSQHPVVYKPEKTLLEVTEEICKSRGLQAADFILKDDSGQQLSGSTTLETVTVDTLMLLKIS